LSEFLSAKQIIKRAKEFQKNFKYKTRLQVFDRTVDYTKSKQPYLKLIMRDITNKISNIKKWTNSQEEFDLYYEIFQPGNVLELDAEHDVKWGSSTIKTARKLSDSEYNLEDFAPTLMKDKKVLIKTLEDTITSIKNESLRDLLNNIFEDKDIKDKYLKCPSSITPHHAYECGNLEHTISMLRLFQQLIDFYDEDTQLNIDLIYSGIILHDIGKIFEYSLNNTIPQKNPDSTLLGHHILGDELVTKFIKEIEDFPKDLGIKIRHIIVSHHGKKEWGASIEPRFPEAEIIHYLDMIDSRFKLRYLP